MLVFKVFALLLLSLIGFIFEIKNIVYYINTPNLIFLILNVIAFSLLGYMLMVFGKKNDEELMEKSKRFDFLTSIFYFSMGLSFFMSIPMKIIFDPFDDEYFKDASKKDLFLFYVNGSGSPHYAFFLALFCIEIWLWIYMVDKIGWGNILLEIFGSLIFGIYIFVTKNHIFSKLGGACLVLPFFCTDIVGIVLGVISLVAT